MQYVVVHQEGEGDEEEDDDPDYQPPPVSRTIVKLLWKSYAFSKTQSNSHSR